MVGLWIVAVVIAGIDQLPPDVKVFIDRRTQCTHWGGEEAYDALRAAEIEKALRQLRCNSVEAEEAHLRRRYAGNEIVLKALSAEPL